jgi:wyosine [tRNA(Phe)-imidazoG37] synthetase (radical SAM superfamily)
VLIKKWKLRQILLHEDDIWRYLAKATKCTLSKKHCCDDRCIFCLRGRDPPNNKNRSHNFANDPHVEQGSQGTTRG